MRDQLCTLGEVTLSAAKTSYTDMNANMNFDFGAGNLGFFPELFIKIKCTTAAITLAAGDTFSIAIEDSADGTNYGVVTEVAMNAMAAGAEAYIKLPANHKRYVKVFYKYTLANGSTACGGKFDAYLERG